MMPKRKKTIPKTALCFFCQRRFARSRLTKEHVFGSWLIKLGRLERARLTLLNGTSVKYTSLVVPACENCNTKFGSRFEKNVKSILDNFHLHKNELISDAAHIDTIYGSDDSVRTKLTLWLQKLFIGILYFEAHLTNVPPKSIRPVKRALKASLMFRNTCRSIITGRGFNLAATLFVFELPDSAAGPFDFVDSLDPLAVGLKVNNKFFYVAISDGQLTSNYLHGEGLARLRADIMASRFGTVSHLMAFAYALATTRHLPVSAKFLYSDEQILNMSNMGLGPPRPINSKRVNLGAQAIYRQLCLHRAIPLIEERAV